MNKLFFLILFLILSLNFISSVDDRMKIKYCEFALSDDFVDSWEFQGSGTSESFVFKPWNDLDKTGIFLMTNNTNRTLGVKNSYDFIWYSSERDWFNEFGEDGTTSPVPVINVGENKDKWLYWRCKFIVGDYRIFLGDGGSCDLGYLTNDFNLTKGLFTSDSHSSGIPHISTTGDYLYHMHPKRWTNNLNLDESGLFPNTEPYSIYREANLNTHTISVYRIGMNWLMREIGSRKLLVSHPIVYAFYVNNSIPSLNPAYTLKPKITKYLVKDETTGNTSVNSVVIPGHNYSQTITFYNPYLVDLEFEVRHIIYSNGWPVNRGLIIPRISNSPAKIEIITIPAESYVNITHSHLLLPFDKVTGDMRSSLRYFNTNYPSGVTSTWPRIGWENYPYLTFGSIDPRVSIADLDYDGKKEPVFNISLELYAEYSSDIEKDDYILEGRVYYDSLIESNLLFVKNYTLDSSILKGHYKKFNWIVPIESSWPKGKYYVSFLSRMNKSIEPHPDFEGEYVSMFNGHVYFNPGDLQSDIERNNEFQFVDKDGFREDSKSIEIFNPDSENSHFLTLEILALSDTQNFSIDLSKSSVFLGPMNTTKVIINVSTLYSTWPVEAFVGSGGILEESFILRVRTDQIGVEPSEVRYLLKVFQEKACEVDRCYWNTSSANAGDLLNLTVETKGKCEGLPVDAVIKKCLLDDCNYTIDVLDLDWWSNTILNNKSSLIWKAKVFNLAKDNETLVFESSVLGSNKLSNKINIKNPSPVSADFCRVL
jgi:hypothetical protein